MSRLSIAKMLVSNKAVGVPAAGILNWMGQMHYRSRVLELCNYWPRIVPVSLPAHFGESRQFYFSSANRTDQISWRLWTEGWNGFERPMLDLFAAAAQRSQTIVDVGANAGLYSVLAGCASDEAVVHAFEPLPQALKVLRENIGLNEFKDRICVMPMAVADQSGDAELYVPAGNEAFLEMSASLSSDFRDRHAAVISVPVTTVDDYVEKVGIERIDILKIDVESQEHRVLAGAHQVMADHRPMIFLEVLADANMRELETMRSQHEYAVCRLRPAEIVEVKEVAHDKECPNQLLVPVEEMSLLGEIAHAAKLRIVRPTRRKVRKLEALVGA